MRGQLRLSRRGQQHERVQGFDDNGISSEHLSDLQPAERVGECIAYRPGKRDHPVWCQKSTDRLGGPLFIVVEDSAQPFSALNSGTHVGHTVRLLDQPIVEPLVVPLNVIVGRIFLHCVA